MGLPADEHLFRAQALSAAGELDGTLDRSTPWSFTDPVIVQALPTTDILETFRVNLNAERAVGKHLVIGISVTDTGEVATYQIRNQVAIFTDSAPADPDGTITGTKNEVLACFLNNSAPATVAGSLEKVAEFFSLMDKVTRNGVNMALPN
ncbi:MAG: alkyl sulfatase C-terminal domain-containing protein [Nostocoides sp.]